MGLSRLHARAQGGQNFAQNFTWPGFVDGLASLLMVFVFVLMVFILIQANLSYRLSGQNDSLSALRLELTELTKLLSIERNESADLSAALARITAQLKRTETENRELNTALKNEATSLRTALENAQTQLTKRAEELETEQQRTANAQTEIAELTLAMQALQTELTRLKNLLAEKEQQAAKDKIAIANLDQALNNALANKVEELQRFRSEFFGRLRTIMEDRSDVKIVGDRFVFQSEVLFAPGHANIAEDGQKELAQIAIAIIDIIHNIPSDIPWILQVDGHTDDVPVVGSYADNWDLSTERALSVVRFMIQNGVPAERLAATGYGEFQPIAKGTSPADRQKNRRIELKLTQWVKTN